MTLLIIGLILWWGAHIFKRVAPDARARMGDKGKGVFALLLLLSVILMVIGYRGADFIPVYTPPSWTVHLVDLFMIAAIALFGLGKSKSTLRGKLRHPQLTGFGLWAFLHLIVNGDLASVVLFGGLLLWVFVQIPLINRAEPAPAPWKGGSMAGNIRLLVISLVLYAIIAGIHTWLGVSPFGG
ncbi:NnrU family protein [Palleronia caenipelagi]|uniref:NnrU domain-containing protein n=1 Tax=Palleronia caenipelagi TaxID=2489174 RepID=A0A547QAS4_9RHOB|nr:NnrU family protein [Palleronia caenipelagi]TRD23495.1 hypothetical protein FEV53_00315 [Palleronia caenipelagi]